MRDMQLVQRADRNYRFQEGACVHRSHQKYVVLGGKVALVNKYRYADGTIINQCPESSLTHIHAHTVYLIIYLFIIDGVAGGYGSCVSVRGPDRCLTLLQYFKLV